MRRFLMAAVALVLVLPAAASAGVPECDSLAGPAAVEARAVMASEFMYACCDDTIAKCLAGRPECRAAAENVARHVCRRAAAGDNRQAITRSLEKRAMTVAGPRSAVPATFEPGAILGDPAARVTVMIYACARCPFCSRLLPKIRQEVVSGRLSAGVRVVIRPFPIKSHANSAEANQALSAAIALGHGWDFLLEDYRRFDTFSVAAIPEMAVAAGMDRAGFDAAYNAPATRQSLVESKREGLRLGVEATPTLFINGRLYQSELDIDTVVDVVLEMLGSADR